MEGLDSLFSEHEIAWDNGLSVLMDSCAVMRGSKAGLEVRIRDEKNAELLDIDGDICHHIHNSSQRLCQPFNKLLEDLFSDLFNDHRYSIDLREMLHTVCTLLGIKFTVPERFLNHRWLSAYDCALSTKRLWDAYQVFYYAFLSQEDKLLYRAVILGIIRERNVSVEARQKIKETWAVIANKSLTEE